jgi:hypothetical protein
MHRELYFLSTYAGIVILAAAVWVWSPTFRYNPRRFFLAVLLLALLPILPYGIVACQTALFCQDLLPPTRQALREIGFSDRILTLKVLQVGPRAARVYTVTPCLPYESNDSERRAEVVCLLRSAEGWRTAGPGTEEDVWSECGSANGNVFPPYSGKGER